MMCTWVMSGFVGLFLVVSVLLPGVFAYTADVSKIPNGDVFSCDTCHSSGNDFIGPYNSAGSQWTAALAALDSDGDGYSNGVELQDPTGAWSQGQPAPGNPNLVTNPGEASSHPAGTPSVTPTRTPTRTPTPIPPTTTPTVAPSQPTNTPQPSTSTPVPTDPPATATPELPTPTDIPTETPAIDTPTPDPGPCADPRVVVTMPQVHYVPGDVCGCTAYVCNPGPDTLIGYPLFAVIDVYGSYYFAPGFTRNLDYYLLDFTVGQTAVIVIPTFVWPTGAGSGDGVRIYGALTMPDMSELFGSMGQFRFGWSE